MLMKDLILNTRCYRRFGREKVARKTLEQLVELARLSASARNLQPLKYFLSCGEDTNTIIFMHLAWAGYLEGWGGPQEDERPMAYILILGDKTIDESFAADAGIAVQSIRLGVTEMGLGSCVLGSIQRQELAQALNLSTQYEIVLAIAIGKPAEQIVLEPVGEDGSTKYWRDAEGVHHVPKRSLAEVLIN